MAIYLAIRIEALGSQSKDSSVSRETSLDPQFRRGLIGLGLHEEGDFNSLATRTIKHYFVARKLQQLVLTFDMPCNLCPHQLEYKK